MARAPLASTVTITSGPIAPGDVDRVARLILSRGIGIVYSGGGARGIAELGVLRALREAGVPIDVAGGTSIGSIMAGATMSAMDTDAMTVGLREALVDGRSPVDFTFPAISIAAGGGSTKMQDAAAASTSRTAGSTASTCRPT